MINDAFHVCIIILRDMRYVFPWTIVCTHYTDVRHNDHDGVSNHQPHGCLLNRLFRRRSKKTPKLRVTGLRVGISPGPVNYPHKGSVTRKMFPFDDVITKTVETQLLSMAPDGPTSGARPSQSNFLRWHVSGHILISRGIIRASQIQVLW